MSNEIDPHAAPPKPEKLTFFKIDGSNVESIAYDEKAKKLHVIFSRKTPLPTKKVYAYPNFSKTAWEAFFNSESKGVHFSQYIRGQHTDFTTWEFIPGSTLQDFVEFRSLPLED